MTKYLYSKRSVDRKGLRLAALTFAVSITASIVAPIAAPIAAQAQYRAPQEERKTPRALGVVETYKNGTRRLVPVTFYYERHFYDANLYHATPVPLTLYSETLYEVQQFGKKLGTFTVLSATQVPEQSLAQMPPEWFGNGRFRLASDEVKVAKKRPARVVVEDPRRPVLHRREGSEGDNPPAHPSETVATKTSPDEDDPDRPVLHRKEGSGDATGGGASGGTATASGAQGQQQQSQNQKPASASQTEESSGQDPNRPVLHRKSDSGSGTAASSTTTAGTATAGTATAGTATAGTATAGASTPAATGGGGSAAVVATKAELTPSDDPDHPILRRGKPVQEQSGGDLPDFRKEEPVTREVAVSDAGPATATQGQELIYVCREPERNLMESEARELAQTELRRLAAQRGLVLPKAGAAKKVAAKAGSRTKSTAATAQLPELTLQDERFVPYDLDYNNYATVVFSARYAAVGGGTAQSTNGTAAKGVAKGKQTAVHPQAPGGSWVVTVVAREDAEGKLTKVYSAVSDPRELDLYPEVRVVDAVDPDGYGRQALLFRERKGDGVSWLLGRVVGYDLETLFETAER